MVFFGWNSEFLLLDSNIKVKTSALVRKIALKNHLLFKIFKITNTLDKSSSLTRSCILDNCLILQSDLPTNLSRLQCQLCLILPPGGADAGNGGAILLPVSAAVPGVDPVDHHRSA